MAFSVTNIGTNANTSGATVAITVPAGGVPAAAVICVGVCERVGLASPTALGTIADTASNSYATATSIALNNLNSNGWGGIIFAGNVSALVSGNTITYTKNQSGNNASISAFYITGCATVSPHDSAAAASASGLSTTPSVTSGTPANTGDIFVGLAATAGNSGTFTQDSTDGAWATPFVAATTGTTATDSRVNGANLVVADGATHKYAPTFSSSQPWAASITAFKAAAVASLPLDRFHASLVPPPVQPQPWTQSLNPPLYSNPPLPAGKQPTSEPKPPAALRLADYSWIWTLDPPLYNAPPVPAGAQVWALPPRGPLRLNEYSWVWTGLPLQSAPPLPAGQQTTDFVRPPAFPNRSSTLFYYSVQSLPFGAQWTSSVAPRIPGPDQSWIIPALRTVTVTVKKGDPFRKDYLLARRKALKNIAKAEMERREYAWHQKAEERKKLRMDILRSMYPDRYPPEIDEDEDERDIEFILLNL